MTTIPRTAEDIRSPMAELLAEGTQALTALAPIIPGRRQQLQQVLAGVGRRIAVGGPSPLDDIGTVHFARCASSSSAAASTSSSPASPPCAS